MLVSVLGNYTMVMGADIRNEGRVRDIRKLFGLYIATFL